MTLGPATFKVTLISLHEFKFNALADKEVVGHGSYTASSRNTATGSGYQHLVV